MSVSRCLTCWCIGDSVYHIEGFKVLAKKRRQQFPMHRHDEISIIASEMPIAAGGPQPKNDEQERKTFLLEISKMTLQGECNMKGVTNACEIGLDFQQISKEV
jgi:hypothetical protein